MNNLFGRTKTRDYTPLRLVDKLKKNVDIVMSIDDDALAAITGSENLISFGSTDLQKFLKARQDVFKYLNIVKQSAERNG